MAQVGSRSELASASANQMRDSIVDGGQQQAAAQQYSPRTACYFTAADIWPHVHGSDHAPAVADFTGPLPQPAQPPSLASCYTFTGMLCHVCLPSPVRSTERVSELHLHLVAPAAHGALAWLSQDVRNAHSMHLLRMMRTRLSFMATSTQDDPSVYSLAVGRSSSSH